MLYLFWALASCNCLAAKPVKMNLLSNGDFEQLNSDPIVIQAASALPELAVSVPGVQSKGASLPAEMGIYAYKIIPIPGPLEVNQPYTIEVSYWGSSDAAAEQKVYVLDGTQHRELFALSAQGDESVHVARTKITFKKVTGNALVLKKTSGAQKNANPVLKVQLTPDVAASLPRNWRMWREGKSFAYLGLDKTKSHSGQTSVAIADALTEHDSLGWETDSFAVGEQEYQLSVWAFPTQQKVTVQLGIAWYQAEDRLLKEDLITVTGKRNSWEQLVLQVRPPVGAKLGRVFLRATNLKKAWVWFDDVLLLGDPTISLKKPSVPLSFQGNVTTEMHYLPENDINMYDLLRLYMTANIGNTVKGELRFGGIYENNKRNFTATSPRQVDLRTTDAKLMVATPIYPDGPVVNAVLGTIDAYYSPYIAFIGYSSAGGYLKANGIKLDGSWPYGQYSSFSFWDSGKQTLGAKLSGNLWDAKLALIMLTSRQLKQGTADGVSYYLPGARLENAFSLEAGRKFGKFEYSGVYNQLQSNNQGSKPESGIFKLKAVNLLPGINPELSLWFCDADFKPSYRDHTPRGYSYSDMRFYEGNWVDNHLGQRGVNLIWNAGKNPLELKGEYEIKQAQDSPDDYLREKMGLTATIHLGKNVLALNCQQRLESRVYLDNYERYPIWQTASATITRPVQGIFAKYDAQYSYEVEAIQNQSLTGQEIRLSRRIQEGPLSGLRFYFGYRLEDDGLAKKGYLKLGGTYATPGGLNLQLTYSNPNKPHTGYYDSVREEYIPADNEFVATLQTWL
jgi:hypothetical protein